MKKRVLFFDCFYSFSSLLSPLSLSKLHILSSKTKKLAKARAPKKDFNKEFLPNATFYGQLSSILYFIRSTNFDLALAHTALGGHLYLCKYFIKLGANDFNLALASDALGGNQKICKYFIKIGATDINRALVYAAFGGHQDLCSKITPK